MFTLTLNSFGMKKEISVGESSGFSIWPTFSRKVSEPLFVCNVVFITKLLNIALWPRPAQCWWIFCAGQPSNFYGASTTTRKTWNEWNIKCFHPVWQFVQSGQVSKCQRQLTKGILTSAYLLPSLCHLCLENMSTCTLVGSWWLENKLRERRCLCNGDDDS